jgi:hypothetical protein
VPYGEDIILQRKTGNFARCYESLCSIVGHSLQRSGKVVGFENVRIRLATSASTFTSSAV